MANEKENKTKKKVKQAITAIAILLLFSIGIGVGNYFTLKKHLGNNVDRNFETLRVVMEKVIMQTMVHNASTPAKLQGLGSRFAIPVVDTGNVDENDVAKVEEGEVPVTQEEPYLGAMLRIVAELNATMEDELHHMDDVSHALKDKLDDAERKIKLLEEKLNTGGVGGIGLAAANEIKNQMIKPASTKVNQNKVKSPAKQNKANKGQHLSDKHVYFSVALTSAMTDIGRTHLIPFDKVINNEGGGYDAAEGKFKTPIQGTYLFMFFVDVVNEEGKRAHVNLLVDGQVKASAIAEAWHKGQEMTSANAVIMHLKKDQNVWIQTTKDDDTLYDIDGQRTTFTGILMFS